MRRLLAITILLGLWAPLVLSMFASSGVAESSLPACCRKNGAHHCLLMRSNPSDAPAMQARCSMYPSAVAPVQVAATGPVDVLALNSEAVVAMLPGTPVRPRVYNSSVAANPKRGPPSAHLA